MRVVGYLRVSTDRQAEEGLGLDVQEEAVHEYAMAHQHIVVAVHRDEGRSGTYGLEGRLGLANALTDIKQGRADAIVVYRLDRLARDLVLQEQLLTEVWRMGGDVLSTAGGEGHLRDDPDDPSRRLIRQVLGAVAEYERAMIALRLRRGRAAKAARGGFAYGSPPLGQRAENRELTADMREQLVVARILELRAAGHSLRHIATMLEAEGHRPKRGATFYPATVARALRASEQSARDGAPPSV
jgi:DNA invertase Pin-like site-specific DNA recombinase